MSNYSQLRRVENNGSYEGIVLLERGGFPEYEFEISTPFAGSACEMAHSEEVVVITGTIKISP